MEIIYGYQNPERTKIELMTLQQALQDDYYHKIFKEDDGLIKKIETYKNQSLWAIEYYLDTGENESQLLNDFYQLVDFVSFFDRKTPIGTYYIEKERIYEKNETSGLLDNHHIRVFNAQDRLVCYSSTDENDNPYVAATQKYFYTNITTIETNGTSSTDLFYLEFNYDNNGDITGVDVNKGHIVEENKHLIDTLDDIAEVIESFGTSNDYSYYLHANWMP